MRWDRGPEGERQQGVVPLSPVLKYRNQPGKGAPVT
jgi:hypothetical protein